MASQNGGPYPSLRVLVVDDNDAARLRLKTILEAEGYEVREARDSGQALEAIAREPMALVTIALGAEGDDGLALARGIRRLGTTPIIALAASLSVIDRVVSLGFDADDYNVTPLKRRELLARVRAVLRRSQPQAAHDPRFHSRFAFASYEIDIPARTLRRSDGQMIDLTSQERALLEAFVRRPGCALSRDALLATIGDDDGARLDRAVDTLVSRLRRKIEPASSRRPELIKTVRGEGYILTAAVRAI